MFIFASLFRFSCVFFKAVPFCKAIWSCWKSHDRLYGRHGSGWSLNIEYAVLTIYHDPFIFTMGTTIPGKTVFIYMHGAINMESHQPPKLLQNNCHWHLGKSMIASDSMTKPWRILNSITVTPQWARWRLKSPASPLFTQPFSQTQIKENINALCHWPLCGEFTGDRWIPRTNGQ